MTEVAEAICLRKRERESEWKTEEKAEGTRSVGVILQFEGYALCHLANSLFYFVFGPINY